MIKLQIKTENNLISNLDELLKIISSQEGTEEFIEHLETTKNHISELPLANKDELLQAIEAKIIEYKNHLENDISNAKSLQNLQQTNQEFQKLKVISTNRLENDSNKYVDYLTLIDENGELQVLAFTNNNDLHNFIRDNASLIPTLTAKDFFQKVSEKFGEKQEFASENDFFVEEKKEANTDNDELVKSELNEIEEYKKKFGFTEKTEISINENQERLYRIGDGLIKFHTEKEKRVMDVLQTPSIKTKNVYDDLLAELEDDREKMISEPIKVTTEKKEDSYSDLPFIDSSEFDKERFRDLLSKRDIYEETLSYDDEHLINVGMKYLIENMDNEPLDLDNNELITDLMERGRGEKESIMSLFENDRDSLTPLEKEFAEMYQNKKSIVAKQMEKINNKKRVLELNTNNGLVSAVVILELLILATFIMLFLRLDI